MITDEALAKVAARRAWEKISHDALPPSQDGTQPLWRVLAAGAVIEICILHVPAAVALKCFEVRMKAMH